MMTTIIIVVFIVGYFAIVMERFIGIHKTATALITAVGMWTVYIVESPSGADAVTEQLVAHLGDFSGILFFLMAAMTIVELVDSHDGFNVITGMIKTTSKRKLLWIITFVTFCLSSVLDNMLTAIVMGSLATRLLSQREEKLLFVGMIVIASNAGGAWSPIGDVTTTMLWIGGQITSAHIMSKLFLPSLVACLVPLIIITFKLKGSIEHAPRQEHVETAMLAKERVFVLILGIIILLFVPVFKVLTHLPPYMGILLGLGILWVILERLHASKGDEARQKYSVARALQKIDMPSVLFFLGILAIVSVLESTTILSQWAQWLDVKIHNVTLVVMIIGILSSILGNVPLIAGSMGMYDMSIYPVNHHFWTFLSYCAGTGGSVLIIGSAAGVAVMGISKVDFFWYLKNIGVLALIGYVAGAGCYLLLL